MMTTTSDYDKEKLQERLAELALGVAVIRVGTPSEAETKSKKEALDDAISATKAAVAERIVPAHRCSLVSHLPWASRGTGERHAGDGAKEAWDRS